MFDDTNVLSLIVIAILGVIGFFAGREVWRGILEGKQAVAERATSNTESRERMGAKEEGTSSGAGMGGQSTGSRSRNGPRAWNEVLGVSPEAGLAEIRMAYRQMIASYHPDRVAGLGEELREIAERRAKEINAAYAFAIKLRQA